MGLQRTTHDIIDTNIRNRKPFTRGNVKGRTALEGLGILPAEWRDQLLRAEPEFIEYVVYSYGTPVAWKFTNRSVWIFPNVKYSATTTQHQSAVRYALRSEDVSVYPEERQSA